MLKGQRRGFEVPKFSSQGDLYSGADRLAVVPGRSTSPIGPEGEMESSEAGTAAVEMVGKGTSASRETVGATSGGC